MSHQLNKLTVIDKEMRHLNCDSEVGRVTMACRVLDMRRSAVAGQKKRNGTKKNRHWGQNKKKTTNGKKKQKCGTKKTTSGQNKKDKRDKKNKHAQTGPPGLGHGSPRTPNVHISGPLRFKTPTKIPRNDSQEREERKRIVAGDGKKKREILGPPPFGAPPFGAPPFGAPPFGAPPF